MTQQALLLCIVRRLSADVVTSNLLSSAVGLLPLTGISVSFRNHVPPWKNNDRER